MSGIFAENVSEIILKVTKKTTGLYPLSGKYSFGITRVLGLGFLKENEREPDTVGNAELSFLTIEFIPRQLHSQKQ